MTNSIKKIFAISVILFSILLIGIGVLYLILKISLPQYSGNVVVEIIEDEIMIYRDSIGVVYINASTDNDAAFGLGYVHAQERLFQMEMMRRASLGKLSEVLGSQTLPIDKMFRILGFNKIMKPAYDELDEITKDYIDAYVSGINYYITKNESRLGIEFDLLNFEPGLWKPEEIVAISKLLAWELNISWWSKYTFIKVIQKFGYEKASEILPGISKFTKIDLNKTQNDFNELNELFSADLKYREFFGLYGTHIGSNNWAVKDSLSISGLPIVANDTHLAFQQPGKWFAAVIKGSELDAAGFTIPGLPNILIGKNQNISWTTTNLMLEDTDFYLEKLDSAETQYFYDGTWKNLVSYKDTILVKDSAHTVLTVKKTFRGPIISGNHIFDIMYSGMSKKNNVSMRWTGFEFSKDLNAFLKLNKAENWNEFKEALKEFCAPAQNFIYTDSENNIGYLGAGKLPLRIETEYLYIHDGSTGKYDWEGFVPSDEMPQIFNPKNKILATANNKVIDNFPHFISNLWEPPSRINRINELLLSKSTHSIKDFRKYQMDQVSPYAKKITAIILDSYNGTKIENEKLKTVIELLKTWNFDFDYFSQTPLIYLTIYQKMLENIFLDEMGEELFKEFVFLANTAYNSISDLLLYESSTWFDDQLTSHIETRNEIIRKSVDEAINSLENQFGSNIALWQWGEVHKVTFKHLFHGHVKFFDRMFDVGSYTVGGDGTTLFNTEYSFAEPFEVTLGPAMRFIYDFGNQDTLYFVLPTGQSGHFLSSHYQDMTEYWISGKLYTVNTDWKNISENYSELLILTPE